MGIDISVESAVLPKQWLFRAKGRKAIEMIAEQAHAWADARGLGPFFDHKIVDDATLEISVLPVADSICVSVDNHLTITVRTSNAGPGYHAAVGDLLDHLAAKLS